MVIVDYKQGFWEELYLKQQELKIKPSMTFSKEDSYKTTVLDMFPFEKYGGNDFTFTHSPIMNKVHTERINKSLELQTALNPNRNWTNLLFKDLIWRLGKGHKNVIIIGYGYTGVGKSSVSQFWGMAITQLVNQIMGKKLEKEEGRLACFDASNICMSRTSFLERIETAIPGELIILDEDDSSMVGLGSVRQREELEKIEKVTRAEQLNFWYNSPMLENHNEHFMIKGLDSSFGHALDRAVLYVKDNNLMYEAFAHLITPHTQIEGYVEKKMKYIEQVKKKTTNEMYEDYEKTAYKMMDKHPNVFYAEDKYGNRVFNGKFKVNLVKAMIRKEFPRYGENEYREIINAIFLRELDLDAETSKVNKLSDFQEGGENEFTD